MSVLRAVKPLKKFFDILALLNAKAQLYGIWPIAVGAEGTAQVPTEPFAPTFVLTDTPLQTFAPEPIVLPSAITASLPILEF